MLALVFVFVDCVVVLLFLFGEVELLFVFDVLVGVVNCVVDKLYDGKCCCHVDVDVNVCVKLLAVFFVFVVGDKGFVLLNNNCC